MGVGEQVQGTALQAEGTASAEALRRHPACWRNRGQPAWLEWSLDGAEAGAGVGGCLGGSWALPALLRTLFLEGSPEGQT